MSGKNSAVSSKRAKLEAHFSSALGKKNKDMLENDDIYDHTKHFFKKDSEGEVFASTIEIGQRKIKGDMLDLDELVYGGKKVTREDLNKEESDEDEGSDEVVEMDDDEEDDMEDDDEELEDEEEMSDD